MTELYRTFPTAAIVNRESVCCRPFYLSWEKQVVYRFFIRSSTPNLAWNSSSLNASYDGDFCGVFVMLAQSCKKPEEQGFTARKDCAKLCSSVALMSSENSFSFRQEITSGDDTCWYDFSSVVLAVFAAGRAAVIMLCCVYRSYFKIFYISDTLRVK
uniref:Uncharacterized protein n=1 Tax=Spironucleus salmonicida TaxID=348837 RepID=V6LWI9_9EUKA|eukprot:EST48076.1 Hypothetical protein SS50377_11773 [Spironucleus salmonicida]